MAYAGTVVVPLSLLLLPLPPWPWSRDSLRDAFAKPLESVLKQLQYETSKSTTGAKLDVALSVPYLHRHRDMPRAVLYDKIQTLVAGVYKLICIVAAKNGVNVEDAEGIDVRLLLLAQPEHDGRRQHAERLSSPSTPDPVDVVVDLRTLASSQRPWQSVFSVDTDNGNQILHEFLIYQDKHLKIRKVDGNTTRTPDKDGGEDYIENYSINARHHTSIAVGGTFDHIHIGHKLLLTMFAFLLSSSQSAERCVRNLTVGITGDSLLGKKKFPELLESWEVRQHSVAAFLQAIMDFKPSPELDMHVKVLTEPGPNGHAVHIELMPDLIVKCVEINDPFGPTITDRSMSALVISGETRAGGKAVNEKRAEKGWPELGVFEVSVLDAEEAAEEGTNPDASDTSFKNKLSSTQIRQAIWERARARSKV